MKKAIPTRVSLPQKMLFREWYLPPSQELQDALHRELKVEILPMVMRELLSNGMFIADLELPGRMDFVLHPHNDGGELTDVRYRFTLESMCFEMIDEMCGDKDWQRRRDDWVSMLRQIANKMEAVTTENSVLKDWRYELEGN